MKEKIRVAQIIPSMNVGGREKVVLDILENIDRSIFDIELICLSGKGKLYQQYLDRQCPLIFLNKQSGFSLSLYFRMYSLFKEKRYDVVHSHNPGAFFYSAIPAKLMGVPVIINSEHGYSARISIQKRFVETLIRNSISMTIAVSEDLRNVLQRVFYARKGKVYTLYNGIDPDPYAESIDKDHIRQSLGLDKCAYVVGIVGRLAEVKDHPTLFSAFKEVLSKEPAARLLIVGDGEKRDDLLALARSLEIDNETIFTGERKDIPELLSCMDVFVLSSKSEGISITLLEAMASGLPIVATSVGGNVEVVIDGDTGLLVPSGDPPAMADAITQIICDKNLRNRLSESGRQRVMNVFNIHTFIRQLETIYMQLLDAVR